MRKLILMVLVFSAVVSSSVDASPKHSHQHRDTVATEQAVAEKASPKHRHQHRDTVVTGRNAAERVSVTAYSDTRADANDSAEMTEREAGKLEKVRVDDLDPGKFSDPFTYFAVLWTAGIGGVLIALFIVLVTLLILLLPVVIVVALLRYLYKRHNDNVALSQKAIDSGIGVVQPGGKVVHRVDEYMWRNGIRNTGIGLGLVLMFGCWGAAPLAGIGFLVMCFGLSQVIIARTTYRSGDGKRKADDDNGDTKETDIR